MPRTPFLLNTSLNIGGNPIAATPRDAYKFLSNTGRDTMVVGDETSIYFGNERPDRVRNLAGRRERYSSWGSGLHWVFTV